MELHDNEIKNSASLGDFKRKLLATIRPPMYPIFNAHDIIGIKRLTKLLIKFCDSNEHKFLHNFCMRIVNIFFCTALCMTLYGRIFLVISKTFLSSTFRIWTPNHSLVYSFSENLAKSVNKMIIEETIRFIDNTKRL